VIESVQNESRFSSVDAAEDAALKKAVTTGLIDTDYRRETYHRERFGAPFRTEHHDKFQEFRYFSESMYSKHLKQFTEKFENNVQIFIFENLVTNYKKCIEKIINKLDIGIEKECTNSENKNSTVVPCNKLARSMLYMKDEYVPEVLKKASNYIGVKRQIGSLARKVLTKEKPSISRKHYAESRAILEDEYEKWHKRRPVTRDLWTY
jgi:hypothetical protein